MPEAGDVPSPTVEALARPGAYERPHLIARSTRSVPRTPIAGPYRWMEGALSSTRSRAGGQGLAEYALILSLIALAVVAVLFLMGGNLKTLLSDIGTQL